MAQQRSAVKTYIHELIDVVGHNRARYMHHMTANWVPVALSERSQRCFGVWATVGSTGRWPEVVNMWELDGWDGLVRNFEVEFAGGQTQDASLAEWWSVAASLRRGGVDRIVVPEPGTRGIDELVADGVRGEVYVHELVTVPPGTAGEVLEAFASEAVAPIEGLGLTHVGTFRVAMVNESECLLVWAAPSWTAWAAYEQAWAAGGALEPWRKTTVRLGADWRRTLMVDAPLAPLRLGRQPAVSDRRPLEEIG
jgi:hypothetical protein